MSVQITPAVASRFRSDGGSMFGLVPKPIWAKLIPPNDRNAIPQNANVLLLELEDGRRGLVDSGCGPAARFSEKELALNELSEGWPLLDALRARGWTTADLDFVVLTHLHWDHAGGATSGRWADGGPLTFPNAVHYVHALEWEDAMSGDPLLYRSYPEGVVAPLKAAPGSAIRQVHDAQAEILPGIRLERTGGHTRGHCAVVFAEGTWRLNHPEAARFAGAGEAIFAADVCPTSHHLRMVFQTAYDTHPLQTRAWKREHFPRCAARKTLLLFDHDPECSGATIRPDEKKEFVVDRALPVA